VHLLLDVREEGNVIRFRDTCGQSFIEYHGRWVVSQSEGSSTVAYELHARPSFSVPEFLLKRLLRRDAIQMIERMQREIAARAAQ
jgi:hypothetical protein